MIDFDFLLSTKVYFGKDREKEVGKIIKGYGFKKILLHYGQNSIKKSGLYDIVINSLKDNDIEYVELGGVRPNPELKLVKEGIEICKKENVELILAVGGGSTLDSSKLIAHGVFYDGDPYDISMHKYVSNKALPVGSIITIAAAGSEMSNSCVISDSERRMKMGFNTELNRPLFAIENPELTYSLPSFQTGCGITDIISHTFERYFGKSEDIELADYLAEGLLKAVIDAAYVLIDNPNDYNARATIMLASSYSHNGITSMGKSFNMPIHQLEHQVSAVNEKVAHGAGLAILIPAWMKNVYKYDENKFIKFSKNVMMVQESINNEEIIIKGIEKLEALFNALGMPQRLSEYDITSDDIVFMANRLTDNGNKVYPSNVPLSKELIIKIYNSCL